MKQLVFFYILRFEGIIRRPKVGRSVYNLFYPTTRTDRLIVYEGCFFRSNPITFWNEAIGVLLRLNLKGASTSRNLLVRLRDYRDDTLRFMEDANVPFTNNLSENDIRMTKVQQKISGCFRSLEGAKYFCRIRGYLLTCKKHGIGADMALNLLFQGESPDFMK